MTELTQQRLLDPEPTRVIRLSERPMGDRWCGVDTSTLRVSVAIIGPELDRHVACHSYSRGQGDGARLARIYRETVEFVDRLRVLHGWPGFVLVEQPFAGKHGVPPVSYHVQGLVMAAFAATTGAIVEPVPPPRWKSVALGNGGANKEKVAEWAHLNGCPSTLQDDCDAWAIAEAARRTVRFVP